MGEDFGKLRAQRDEIEGRARQREVRSHPTWVEGRPTEPGIWVLRMQNRDLVTATVWWDEYDDAGFSTTYSRYLRITDGETSEELDRADGQIGRLVAFAFGPIPFPNES